MFLNSKTSFVNYITSGVARVSYARWQKYFSAPNSWMAIASHPFFPKKIAWMKVICDYCDFFINCLPYFTCLLRVWLFRHNYVSRRGGRKIWNWVWSNDLLRHSAHCI